MASPRVLVYQQAWFPHPKSGCVGLPTSVIRHAKSWCVSLPASVIPHAKSWFFGLPASVVPLSQVLSFLQQTTELHTHLKKNYDISEINS